MNSIGAMKWRVTRYRIQRKLHKTLVEPVRKALLFAALHVVRLEDIAIEIMPMDIAGERYVVIRRKGSNAQLSAKVKCREAKSKAFYGLGKAYKAEPAWISFYDHRTSAELLPETSD